MISTIRRYTKNTGVKIILWLTLLSLVGSSFVFLLKIGKSSVPYVATVGDSEISVSEFRRKFLPLAQFSREIKKKAGQAADQLLKMWGFTETPEKMALDACIEEQITLNAFNKIGTSVSKEYLNKKLQDTTFVSENLRDIVPSYVIQSGVINVDQLKTALSRLGISHDEFDQILKDSSNRALFNNMIKGSSYVSIDELKEHFMRLYSKKKFGVLTIDRAPFVKKAKETNFTDREIEEFYKNNSQKFVTDEKRSGIIWEFSPESYGIKVNDKEIEDYYFKNRQNYLISPQEKQIRTVVVDSQQKAQELVESFKTDPAKFDKMANAAVAAKKGEKGAVFDQVIAGLAKDSISPVIRTAQGYEIVKVVGTNEAVYKDFKLVKDEIRNQLLDSRFKNSFTTDANRILSQSADNPELLTKFVKEKQADERKVEDQVAQAEDAEKLFELNREGAKTSYTDDGTGYIVKLDTITKSYAPKLDEIKAQVVKEMYNQKAQELLVKEVDNLYSQIGKTSLDKLGKSFELTGSIDGQDTAAIKKYSQKGIPLNAALSLTTPHSAIKNINDNGYIIELAEIEPIDQKQFDERKKELLLSLGKSDAQTLSYSFIKDLKDKTKININKETMRLASRI